MFKQMKQFIMVVLATATIGVSTVATNVFQPATTVSARSIQADGPWEKDSYHLNILQPVSNGNQIYYSIVPGTKYGNYAQSAATAWNKLGVIDLVQVPYGDSRSQITFEYKNQYSGDNTKTYEEEAGTRFNETNDNSNTAYLNGATIVCYKDMTEVKPFNREVIVEHEFGHALGFAHDNRHLNNGPQYKNYLMTMNYHNGGSSKVYALGGIEQRTLADHYGITPSHWLNTNC